MRTSRKKEMEITEQLEQLEQRIVQSRRNRMKLASFYINVKTIVFYDYTGSVNRVGKVIGITGRGLCLQFRGGYKESFFFETLLELEIVGGISIKD